jgi:VanZ family protein
MTNKASAPLQKSRTKFITGFAISFWKTILWVLVIFILSFLPGRVFEKVKLFDITFQDLIVHFIMYAVFTVLLIKELSSKENEYPLKKAGWIIPLLASAALGVVTEIVQHFWIIGRTGSLSDFTLDICGSAAMIWFCRIPRVRKRLKL